MHNVIIIIMLASLIYNYIFKRRACSDLNCGIFAWTGTSSDKFSPILFNVLGIFNDSRGGDSCGVYFNRGSIVGIKTEAKYESLVKKHKLHTTIKPGKWPIVIGHCRKASVGSVSGGNSQPILLRTRKDERLVYVQAHNGTITNHRELAIKHDIVIEKDESDSVVLSRLIHKVGFSVLSEYEGSAALVMHSTKEPNVLYAFHGQSKNYTTLSEERPLHYVLIKGSGIYISSEAQPLEWISNGLEATAFKHNIVYKIEGETVTEFMKIERETAVMKKWDNTSYKNSEIPFHDVDYRSYNRGNNYEMIKPINTKNICCAMIDFNLIQTHNAFKLRYVKGFFIENKTYAHGEKLVDTWGYIKDPNSSLKTQFVTYYLYFYYGILLSDADAWDAVKKAEFSMNIVSAQDFYTPNNFNALSKVLKENAVYPFTRMSTKPESGYMEPTSFYPSDKGSEEDTFYTGSFTPLFSEYELKFKEGDFIGYKKIYGGTQTISDLLKEQPILDEWGFGVERKVRGDIKVKDCCDCVDRGLYENGERCMHCTVEFSNDDVDKSNENKVMLCHTISEHIVPICGDIEDLIGEIIDSGFKDTVAIELGLLNEANDKLKLITK